MVLEAALRASTGIFMSSYTRFQETSSPGPSESPQTLKPVSCVGPHSAHLLSPGSDMVGPSPVASNGTETTEIDDEEQETVSLPAATPAGGSTPQLQLLKTNPPDDVRKASSEEAVSVIHAPEGFQQQQWQPTDAQQSPPDSDTTVVSPPGQCSARPLLSPIATNVNPAGFTPDDATPQAQNLRDVLGDSSRLRSSSTSSLELIPESHEGDTDAEPDSAWSEHSVTPATIQDSEVRALKGALDECWNLCNTLANLSSIHRERVFSSSGTPDAHEKAWQSCWKLCQKLYDSRDDAVESFHARTDLDMCRDFCQALFDVRQRKEEIGDSVLRVSFELNNHLYSAQDSRNLPAAFRERTLDFYITLCHRLMKQRSARAAEPDARLRACWALAEMLLSLRQGARDRRAPDTELLGAAVQACWELCDLFRAGCWTQPAVRPDRPPPLSPPAPPAPPAPAGHHHEHQHLLGGGGSPHEKRRAAAAGPKAPPLPVPETPVTEFEDTGDTPISPTAGGGGGGGGGDGGASPPMLPRILVLGPGSEGNHWSSSASNWSGRSQSSAMKKR